MMCPNRQRAARGFGLTELLVAVAIFLTIIGAIALVFNGSLRALRQAEQSQQIYEMVRGAMQVMERDLSSAFVAREYGDIYQFYGTPIGFTFVGVVKYNEDDQPNLARVTYVIRRDSGRLAQRTEFGEFVDSAGNPYFENDGIDNNFNGVVDEAGESGAAVPSFSLVRYVERGRDNLETFPINWDAPIVDDSSPGAPDFLGDVIGDPDNPDTTYDNFVGYAIENGLCRADDRRCLEEVAKAGRRQVWIGMLSGWDSAWYTSTSPFPDFFELNGLDPEDYVLLENIAVDDVVTAFTDFGDNVTLSAATRISTTPLVEQLTELQSIDYNGQLFQYTEWVQGYTMDTSVAPPEPVKITRPYNLAFWLDWRNINLSNNGIDDNNSCCDGIDNDGDASIDEADEALMVDCDVEEVINGQDADGLDNNGNGIIDCPDPEELPYPAVVGPPVVWNVAPGAGPGSPLTPNIPQQVNFRFRLFVEAPTVGAPDFERNFNFQLDIPAATARVSTTE